MLRDAGDFFFGFFSLNFGFFTVSPRFLGRALTL